MKYLSIALLLVLAGCSGSDQGAETIRFTYNPPDSLSFEGRVLSERIRSYQGTSSVDTTRVFNHHTLSHTDTGYEYTTVTDSTLMSRNGVAMGDPFAGLFNKITVVHVIDSSGQAVAVKGYEDINNLIDEQFAPDVAAGLHEVISPEMLSGGELDEWNSSVGQIAGLELAPGEPVLSSDDIALPTGMKLSLFKAIELVDTSTIDSVPCARVRIIVHSNPGDLAEMLGQSKESICDYFELTDSAVQAIDLSPLVSQTYTELVVAIPTMLVQSNQSSREMEMSVMSEEGVPGKGSLVETQKKLYTY